MKKTKFTDEELLSYLVGDCCPKISTEIKNQLKDNLQLRKRVETIAFIKGEIKNTPAKYHLKKKKEFNLKLISRQAAFASILFVVGVFTGSNLDILNKKSVNTQSVSKSVSAPLSWDDSKFLSLM